EAVAGYVLRENPLAVPPVRLVEGAAKGVDVANHAVAGDLVHPDIREPGGGHRAKGGDAVDAGRRVLAVDENVPDSRADAVVRRAGGIRRPAPGPGIQERHGGV